MIALFVLGRSTGSSADLLKLYPSTFFFFFFYQYTALSHAVDGHQMYSGGSVVGKASTIGIEISHTPSPNFHRGGQKVRNLASFSTSLKFEPPMFENSARYPNAETNFVCRNDRPMSTSSLVKLGPPIPENRWVVMPTT